MQCDGEYLTNFVRIFLQLIMDVLQAQFIFPMFMTTRLVVFERPGSDHQSGRTLRACKFF